MKDTRRCFVAIPVADDVRAAAAKLVGDLRKLPARVSWVRPENMHMTIRFLGDVAQADVPRVEAAVSAAARQAEPFSLAYGGLGVFPPRGSPRTIWVGLSGQVDSLRSLHGALEHELQKIGFKPEGRRFSPHLTIGRVRERLRPDAWARAREEAEPVDLGEEHVTTLLLVQSELEHGSPPRYTCLVSAALGNEGGSSW